MSYLI